MVRVLAVVGGRSFAEIVSRFLSEARVKLTVDGSGRFRPPTGLGPTRYDGAQIVRVRNPFPSTP